MPDSQRALFLAYSTYTGDKETFENWYDEVHIPDVLSAPGLRNAQRFVLADTKPMPGVDSPDLGHLAYYELEGDPTPFREEVKRQLMSGDMVLPDFLNQPFKTLIMEPVSEIVYADGVEPGTFPEDRHLFMAFSRYTGDEGTFNKWYDEVHVPQVLSAPGLVRAQRFVTVRREAAAGSRNAGSRASRPVRDGRRSDCPSATRSKGCSCPGRW